MGQSRPALQDRLKTQLLFLDGAMGTELQKRGLPLGVPPERMNVTHPKVVSAIHRAYLEAGADILYTNTFGANGIKLADFEETVEEIITAAVQNARNAIGEGDALVALDIGPLGVLLEPIGSLSFEEAVALFRRQADAGIRAGVDLVVLETMSDLSEVKAGILAVRESCEAAGQTCPILATMTFTENRRTFAGVPISAMGLTLEGLGVDVIGINCSLGPTELFPLAEELCEWTSLPILLKPNAGLPDPETNQYGMTPETFAREMEPFLGLGIHLFGGCCGTNPSYIHALKTQLSGKPFPDRSQSFYAASHPAAVCSSTETVRLDRVRVVGERINPTGKPRLKQALLEGDLDYLLSEGIRQVESGAALLDVNLGLPGIDEAAQMVQTVKRLQSVVSAPLQIDSANPAVIEAALRAYNGKAIVNSVNGEDAVLAQFLPIVKRYGAAVIGLTLDSHGIPDSAEDRLAIAKKILRRAEEHGIPKQDVLIDCLTLTAAAQQKDALETLRAVRMVKEQLGVTTILGISNISFGLPNRTLLNQSFLLLALEAGLDLAILDPGCSAMLDAIRAHAVLANQDIHALHYIKAYAERDSSTTGQTDAQHNIQASPAEEMAAAIGHGVEEPVQTLTRRLLERYSAEEIIQSLLIPALDRVGQQYEEGKLFLPQMIQSAQAAKAAFACIKTHLTQTKGEAPPAISFSEEGILLATVQGDIHDIGKNIVKVILENYGFAVLDIGRDVTPEKIVEAVRRTGAKLVGLSALMTTTLVSMEKTITALHEADLGCKIMVGGAVLTPEYARKIGADFYSRDAKQAVDIAKEVLRHETKKFV